MKKIRIVLTAFFALSNVAMLNAQTVLSTTSITDSVHEVDQVVISTQGKKEEKLSMIGLGVPVKFLPMSTNVVDATELELRGIEDIEDAATFMPGVRVSTSYGAFQTLTVRGFSHAPIMVDGVRDERTTVNSYPFMDLTSVESIELLKGPASVLSGFAAVGGVLNVVRKSPEATTNVLARMNYGSYGEKGATLGFGGKIAGPINYSANFNISGGEGYRRTNDSRQSGYFALGGRVHSNGVLDIRGGFTNDFYGTDTGMPDLMSADIYSVSTGEKVYSEGDMLDGLDMRSRYNNESDFMYNKGWNTSAAYTHTFGSKLKLKNTFSYRYDDIDYFSTESLNYLTSDDNAEGYDTYYMNGDDKKYICLDSVVLDYPLRFAHISNTISNNLEFSYNTKIGSMENSLLAGYSFMNMKRDTYTGYSLGTDVQGPGLYSHVSVYDPQSQGYMTSSMSNMYYYNYMSNGFYLQNLLSVSEKFKIMLAGRYDLFSYSRRQGTPIDGERTYDKNELGEESKIVNKAFTYRAGAVYVPIEGLSIFASVANFYKPIYTFYSATTMYIDKNGDEFIPEENGKVFDPESGYQAEAGLKYEFNDILSLNASAFYILKENSVISLGTESVDNGEGGTTNMTVRGQVGRMDSKGFDVDLTLTPYRTLALTLGYSFTDARICEIADNAYMDSYSTAGNFQTGVPRNTAYAMASYTVDRGPLKGFGVHANANFMDRVYRNTANTTWYDSYWRMDAGVSYMAHKNIRLTFNVNNIANALYFNQSVGDQMIPSTPRNYNISVTYKL
ncbi:MAG: TonB-dependent receptor [Rikenellaceae bacterium]